MYAEGLTQSTLLKDMKRVVIYDTNAYRGHFFGKSLADVRTESEAIREAELNRGVFAVASPVVIWEMISHLADTEDAGYNNCTEGLVALARHTRIPGASDGAICLTDFPAALVSRSFFQMTPPNSTANAQALSQLAVYVERNAPGLTGSAETANIQSFSKAMETEESIWKANMARMIKAFDPALAKAWLGGSTDKDVRRKLTKYFKSAEFRRAWANDQLNTHARGLGLTLVDADRERMAADFEEHYETPFRMLVTLLQTFQGPGVNLDRKKKPWANFIWDSALSFALGKHHSMESCPVHIITGDDDLVKAALAAGCADRVRDIKAHLSEVGI